MKLLPLIAVLVLALLSAACESSQDCLDSVVPPPTISLEAFQTPVRNQGSRATCSAFATVAAIEAAYKRDYGLELDLSEQYLYHVDRTSKLAADTGLDYENDSSYWDGGNMIARPISAAYDNPLPLESQAPYKSHAQQSLIADAQHRLADKATATQAALDDFEYDPANIPPAARQNAVYGITHARLLSADQEKSPEALERVLACGHEAILGLNFRYRLIDPDQHLYDFDPKGPGNAHYLLVVGYDRAHQWFLVKNSWGGTSLIKLTYDFIRKAGGEAAFIDSVRDPAEGPDVKSQWLGRWNVDAGSLGQGQLVIRRTSLDVWQPAYAQPSAPDPLDPRGRVTELGTFYSSSGEAYPAHGFFVDGGKTALLTFDLDGQVRAPGDLGGTKLALSLMSTDANLAAGVLEVAGEPAGGVRLERTTPFAGPAPLPPEPALDPRLKRNKSGISFQRAEAAPHELWLNGLLDQLALVPRLAPERPEYARLGLERCELKLDGVPRELDLAALYSPAQGVLLVQGPDPVLLFANTEAPATWAGFYEKDGHFHPATLCYSP